MPWRILLAKTDIWMPLYIRDYLVDTMHLTAEQHGCYLLLLMHQWTRGSIPSDMQGLRNICRLGGDPEHFSSIWNILRPFFSDNGDSFVQQRLAVEKEKSEGRRSERSKSGSLGAIRKWGTEEERNKLTRSERLANARRLATHSPSEWQALLFICENRCAKCNQSDVDLVKDHIIPVCIEGASDGIDNLQPLCRSCNAAKGNERVDYRPNDWKEQIAKRLAEPPNNGWQTPTPSPSPSPSPAPIERNTLSLLPTEEPQPKFSSQAAFSIWNQHCGILPKVEAFTEKRKRKAQARIKSGLTEERFLRAVRCCTEKPFLRGENSSAWTATFDWLVHNDENIEKAINNPYGAGGTNGKQQLKGNFTGIREQNNRDAMQRALKIATGICDPGAM